MAEKLRTEILKNGVMVSFYEQTNRYFGDFHRLCVLVIVELPADFELPAGMSRETCRYQRTLEKMGVTSDQLDAERSAMIDSFLKTAKAYLEKSNFPQQLLHNIQRQNRSPIFLQNR